MELFQKVFFETIWHDQTDTQDSQVRNATAASALRSLEAPANQKWIRGVEHIFLISDAPPEPRVFPRELAYKFQKYSILE